MGHGFNSGEEFNDVLMQLSQSEEREKRWLSVDRAFAALVDRFWNFEMDGKPHLSGDLDKQIRRVIDALRTDTLEDIERELGIEVGKKTRIPDGTPGVRDPDHPCKDFNPGIPDEWRHCEGDGHYLCEECSEKKLVR